MPNVIYIGTLFLHAYPRQCAEVKSEAEREKEREREPAALRFAALGSNALHRRPGSFFSSPRAFRTFLHVSFLHALYLEFLGFSRIYGNIWHFKSKFSSLSLSLSLSTNGELYEIEIKICRVFKSISTCLRIF